MPLGRLKSRKPQGSIKAVKFPVCLPTMGSWPHQRPAAWVCPDNGTRARTGWALGRGGLSVQSRKWEAPCSHATDLPPLRQPCASFHVLPLLPSPDPLLPSCFLSEDEWQTTPSRSRDSLSTTTASTGELQGCSSLTNMIYHKSTICFNLWGKMGYDET